MPTNRAGSNKVNNSVWLPNLLSVLVTLSQVLTHSCLRPDIRFPFGVDQIIHDGPIRECLIREYGDVYKCGRATEYTRGEYSGVGHARISKHVVNNQEVQRTAFEHTVASPPNEPFSLPGDSGTLIFNHSCRVLGMVIGVAEMGGLTFITHIDDLFEDIKATTGAAMVRVPGYKRSS